MIKRLLVLAISLLWAAEAFSQTEKKLSLENALKTAIERNLDIQLQKISVDSSQISLELTRAAYEPEVTNMTDYLTFDRSATNRNESSTGAAISQDRIRSNTTFRKQEDFGFGWQVDFNNSVEDSTSEISFGETFSSSLTIGFEQQLLRGYKFDREISRNSEYVAQGNLKIAWYDYEMQIINIIQETENAYWDLVLAIEQLKVNHQSLELARQLYEQNRVKIEVGTLAPIELVSSEANMASREREIITAENRVLAAEDALKKVMNLKADDWMSTLIPTEPLVISPLETNLKSDYAAAIEGRPEMRKNMQESANALLEHKLRENEKLPELKVSGSYFVNGDSNPIDPATGEIKDASYSDALSNSLSNDFPGWTLALNLSWNPFNKAAKLNLAQARAEMRRNELATEQTKITIMQEVRSANRELESNLKAIKANEKTLKYREENLKAEQQKFQNGLSTNYLVSEAQKDLAEAESQVIASKVDYLKAVVTHFKARGELASRRNISVK